MATLREIVYDISEKLNITSDDSKFSEEHIAFLVNAKRNMLLSQKMSNLKKTVPQEAIQGICLGLEVDEQCFEDINVLKSIVKVPATLDNTGRNQLIKAYPVNNNFTKNFNIIDYSRLPFVGAQKYNNKQIYVTVDPDSYLLVYNSDNRHLMLEELKIEGVFEDPESAWTLSCETVSGDFWDKQYPIDGSLLSILIDQVSQNLIIKYKIPEDEINNSEDNITIEDARRQRV